jgi:uncharacterized protein YlxP (DUF503 family)
VGSCTGSATAARPGVSAGQTGVVYVGALRIDLHVPESRSLKTKRSSIKPIVEQLQRRFHVAVAEVDHQDQWQRSVLGVAVVASSHTQLCEILDEVERFVWSRPDVMVLEVDRTWVEREA